MSNLLKLAMSLCKLGYWAHLIHPNAPDWRPGPDQKSAKRPIGKGWGLERWTEERIQTTADRYPGAGIGIAFGPGRAPGGGWLIDLEGDGEDASASLAKLLGGEIPDTPSWGSRRGDHTLFTVDGERLLTSLTGAGAVEGKGIAAGVWHLPEFPGLEWRIGGYKGDGAVKQVQSVCPPTVGDDGTPRAWKVSAKTRVAELPKSAYAALKAIVERKASHAKIVASPPNERPQRHTTQTDPREKYVLKALEEEIATLAGKGEGERHAYLLSATLRLASLVKAGLLAEREAVEGLYSGARSNGMGEGRRSEIDEAWRSAMEMASPREIPDLAAGRVPSNGLANGKHPLGPSSNGHSVQSVHSVHDSKKWEPITLGKVPAAIDFPLDSFPEDVQRFCRDVSRSIGCPVDIPAGMVLGVASTAIGRSRSLMLKPGYYVNASIWLAVIADVAGGKSPALETVARPIHEHDDELRQEYQSSKAQWEMACAPVKGKKPAPPPPPIRKTVYVDDTTIETLTQIQSDNPRGIGWLCDELSACILGLNQYKGGKGNDRPTLMKMQAGKRFKRNRKGEESLGTFSYLTVFGGIVPNMLMEMKDPQGLADGFLDRFHPIYPEPSRVPEWTTCGVPEAIRDRWAQIVKRVLSLKMTEDPSTGALTPEVVRLGDGEAAFIEGYNRHIAEMNDPGFDQSLRGAWGKYRESAAKLALILGCLREACNPDTSNKKAFYTLLLFDICSCWKLVDYFKAGFRKMKASIEGQGVGDDVGAILGWLRAGDLTEFTERDLYQEAGRFRNKRALMADALAFLAKHHVVRSAPEEKVGPGRAPSPRWEVNPEFYERAQNALIAQNSANAPENGGSQSTLETTGHFVDAAQNAPIAQKAVVGTENHVEWEGAF